LDETLVHCDTSDIEDPDVSFQVDFNGKEYMIKGKLRPNCYEFLQKCSEKFEVVLFTASQKVYADRIASFLDPSRSFFKHRLFRDACVYASGAYIKDLGMLGRDLAKTIIVDNSMQAFAFHLNNGIPIKSWYEDPNDNELNRLWKFLESLADCEDVRYSKAQLGLSLGIFLTWNVKFLEI
jgi:CTD small phosphatase-like protein 2